MSSRDPRCVYLAGSAAQAEVIVTYLAHEGIAARAMDGVTMGGLEDVSAMARGATPGFEVWVLREDQLDVARRLLAERQPAAAAAGTEEPDSSFIPALCEECGRKSLFPPSQCNTVQECPYCLSYLDVPSEAEAAPLLQSSLETGELDTLLEEAEQRRYSLKGYTRMLLLLLGLALIAAVVAILLGN